MTTMHTQYLELPQGRLAFDDRGTGPLVICVPSMGDVRQEYRFLAPMLVEAGYRVVTMDVRGHGEASVNWPDYSVAAIGADIFALMRHLNAGPALLVGNSMAGGASVWAAAQAPELIAGVALIDPFVRDVGPRWPGRLLYPVLFADLWGPAAWSKYYTTLYPTRHPIDWQDYLPQLKRNLSEPGRMRALRAMLLASKQASEDRLSLACHSPILSTEDLCTSCFYNWSFSALDVRVPAPSAATCTNDADTPCACG
jgi:pimeloyl-ACP methyl ester carboxylesterase